MTVANGTNSLRQIPNLDQRWIEYSARTRSVFSSHPYLVPLRQMLFKSYVEHGNQLTSLGRLRHWAKLALRHQRSSGDLSPVDVVFWLDSTREVLVEALIPVLNCLRAAGINAALVTPRHVRMELRQPVSQIVEFMIPYHGQSATRWKNAWNDLLTALPEDLNTASYSAYLLDAFAAQNCVHEAERIFALLKPKLVVCAADQNLPSSGICTAARHLEIPSLVMMHGAIIPYNAPLTAERMAVWGKTSHEQMRAFGVSESQLAILGSPRHDRFPLTSVAEARQRLMETLGLSATNPYFVFFSNGNDPLRNSTRALEGCARWLDAAARSLSGRIDFLVRLHPNESGELYSPYPQLHVFKNECDLDTTLAGVDICGALCSTTLSDALLYCKPVLQFYADGWPNLADDWQRGAAERIVDSQHLIDVLTGSRDTWAKLADRQSGHLEDVFANHGSAVDVVARFISEHIT